MCKAFIGSNMTSVDIASHSASSAFLANLFQEHNVTNVIFLVDNAKSRAAVPITVHLQNSLSVSRWDSIVHTESIDTLDNPKRNRNSVTSSPRTPLNSQNCHSLSPARSSPKAARNSRNYNSLSPTSMDARQKSIPIENFQTKIPDRRWDEGRSELLPLPTRLSSDKNIIRRFSDPLLRIPKRKAFLRPDFVRRHSCSETLLRLPQRKNFLVPDFVRELSILQRKAFVDSKPAAPKSRRTNSRPSTQRHRALNERTKSFEI